MRTVKKPKAIQKTVGAFKRQENIYQKERRLKIMKIHSALMIAMLCAFCVLFTACGKNKTKSKLSDDYSAKSSSLASHTNETDSNSDGTGVISSQTSKTSDVKSKPIKSDGGKASSVGVEVSVPDEWLDSELSENSSESSGSQDADKTNSASSAVTSLPSGFVRQN